MSFLEDNTDKLLIENFVPIYAMRAATFPNSNIHFDKCGIVESNIQTYIDTYCVRSIRERLRYFDETQNRNLVMFMKLKK